MLPLSRYNDIVVDKQIYNVGKKRRYFDPTLIRIFSSGNVPSSAQR